jgi:DNA polymerase-1
MNLSEVPGYLASKCAFNLMGQQAATGFPFDSASALLLAEHIKKEMKQIEDEVEPQLPPRPLKKSEQGHYTVPAKPFKKDGSPSAVMEKWLDKHGLQLIGINHVQWEGELVKIEGGKELPATAKMTLGNQDDIKNWLIDECDWVPTLFNYKKDERGKPVRDDKGKLIPTSPKMQDQGRLCPNLENVQGDVARAVVKWLSFRNRLSVLEGWLSNPRVAIDGRLSASASGITSTHRARHTTVNA